MRKCVDYQIVVANALPNANTSDSLRIQVLGWVLRGYEPQGGPFALTSRDAQTGQVYGGIAQAVAKYEVSE